MDYLCLVACSHGSLNSQYTANTCVCHAKNASCFARGENKLVNSIDPMHAFRMKEKSNVRQKVNCTRLTTLCVINVACNSFRARWAFTALSAIVWRQKPKWNTKRLFVEKIISKLNECSCGANSPKTRRLTSRRTAVLSSAVSHASNQERLAYPPRMGIYQWKDWCTLTQTSPLLPVVCRADVLCVCVCVGASVSMCGRNTNRNFWRILNWNMRIDFSYRDQLTLWRIFAFPDSHSHRCGPPMPIQRREIILKSPFSAFAFQNKIQNHFKIARINSTKLRGAHIIRLHKVFHE